MINELINETTLMLAVVGLVYGILATLIIKSVRSSNDIITLHIRDIYTTDDHERTYDYAILTNSCPICERYDRIHIDQYTLDELTKDSKIDVGEYPILHNGEGFPHIITHYLDSDGTYINYQLPHDVLIKALEDKPNITNT